jgi:putative hydrolase of the HAD superfamily
MLTNKVILWDFDGTLAECPGMWNGALMEVLNTHEPCHQVQRDQIRPFLLEGFFWHKAWETHIHITNADDWWAETNLTFQRAFEGVGFNPHRARELAGLVRQYYVNPSRFKLYDDVLPTLITLQEKGWKQGILSNHVPELANIVNTIGLSPFIDLCISSAVSGYEKPNPLAFKDALRLAGNPEKVWMVGDSQAADVIGAEAVGIKAILVRKPNATGIKHYATNLSEVINIIETEELSHDS